MNNKGTILIISLWILVIISLLCLSLANQVRANLKLIKFQKDKVECLYIAKAAIEKSISVLENDPTPNLDSLNELWSTGYNHGAQYGSEYVFKDIPIGEGFFTITYSFVDKEGSGPVYLYGISDEDRKININKASKELLVILFESLQVNNPQSLAENIIYWRGDLPGNYQDPYYASPEIPYAARKAPLKNIEELSLMKGFREDLNLIKKCESFFTVYTKDSLININTAPEQILKSVFISLGAEEFSPGLSQRLTRYIIDYRDGSDNEETTADDIPITQDKIKEALKTNLVDIVEKGWVDKQVLPFKAKSDVFRIEAVAGLNKSGISKNVTVLVSRNQKPPKIIYWYEE